MSDNVNKPSHYNAGSVETIDGIRAALGEGFADYCKGNVIKYVWRCGKKGDAVEDLKKAAKYLEWAIEAMQGNCPVKPDSSDRKPIAIPAGWRELEPDEVPKATDMLEWMGGWFFRNDDATHEYKWHSSRNIRKIETSEPGPIAIPEGWRELKPDEFPKVTDLYENEGAWRNRINDSSIEYARYEARHIRKIETANTSETPNSSTVTEWMPKIGEFVVRPCGRPAKVISMDSMGGHLIYGCEGTNFRFTLRTLKPWIPKVGDKVRVICAIPLPKDDRFGVVVKDNVRPREDLFLVKTSNGIFSWFYTSELELIEAAP